MKTPRQLWTATVLLATTALPGCAPPVPRPAPTSTPTRQTLQVRGSGIFGDSAMEDAFSADPDWNQVRDGLSVPSIPTQGDTCTTSQINRTLNLKQAVALEKFVYGEPIDRYDPNNGEHTQMNDRMVGWVCTSDGRRTTLYSTQGRYLVLGPDSEKNLASSRPYGPDLLKSRKLKDVLLQGNIIGGVQLDDNSIGLGGADGGKFNLGRPLHPLLTKALTDIPKNATFTAFIQSASGDAVALIYNTGKADRNPNSDAPIIATKQQRFTVVSLDTPNGRAESALFLTGLSQIMRHTAAQDQTVAFEVVR